VKEVPSFSIVVPTHDRASRLSACLRALSRQDYPTNRFDVVVVDDGSPSPLAEIVDPFQEQINVKLVVQHQAGPAAARNAGATHGQGQYLAFTDDDCAPERDWLKQLADGLHDNPTAAVGGRTINALDDNAYSTASQLLIDYIYGYYNADQHDAEFFSSNNFALPAEAFREMGGFDISFSLAAGEDRDFCDRWRSQGGRLHYVPEAVVAHAHSLTFRGFLRQHFNYGRGAFHFHRMRASRNEEPVRVEPASFYANLIRLPLSRQRWAIRLTGLIFLSQAANAAGFYCAKLAGSRRFHHDSNN
jgi:GT2 family glycosyltransferase